MEDFRVEAPYNCRSDITITTLAAHRQYNLCSAGLIITRKLTVSQSLTPLSQRSQLVGASQTKQGSKDI